MRIVSLLTVLGLLAHSVSAMADKPTLVVLDLKAIMLDESVAELVSTTVRTAVARSGAFTVLSRDEMEAIVNEQEFQQSEACDTTQCYAELGGALGAQKMLTGSVGVLGRTYTLSLKIIDLSRVRDEGSVQRRFKGEIDGLLDAAERAVEELMARYLGKPVPAAPPPRPKPAPKPEPKPEPKPKPEPEPELQVAPEPKAPPQKQEPAPVVEVEVDDEGGGGGASTFLLITGGVALAAAVPTGLLAMGIIGSGKSVGMGVVTDVLWIGGGTLLLVGILSLAAEDDPDAVAIAPTLSPGGAGLAVAGRW